jgi:hypothetical protein
LAHRKASSYTKQEKPRKIRDDHICPRIGFETTVQVFKYSKTLRALKFAASVISISASVSTNIMLHIVHYLRCISRMTFREFVMYSPLQVTRYRYSIICDFWALTWDIQSNKLV